MSDAVPETILREMMTYYRERANEYDEWFYRRGRFDRGKEQNALWFAEANQVFAALDALAIDGDVLEFAPGTGIWTERLLQRATSVTAIDASTEMIALNRAKVQSDRVIYQQADIFSWKPERTYDAVYFCFWISHVPIEKLDAFLHIVASAVRPGGNIFFVDGRREQTGTAVDHQLPAEEKQVMARKLNDGREFQIVKNFYEPQYLTTRFSAAGMHMTIEETATYFLYGYGTH